MEKEKLKEIVENTISGEWGTEEKKDENDIFVIRTADFFNDGRINYNNVIKRNIAKRKIEEKSLKIGDIIVEKSGGTDKNPVGRVVLFERENYKGLANNFTQVLRIKKEYYYKFIFYQLLYKYKNGSTLQMFNKTTGIQNLQMKLYLNQELNVCDKKEQIKISNLLDKVQEIIDISEKQVEHLDELIKSQFVEMFGNPIQNDKKWDTDLINNVAPSQNYKGSFEDKVWLLNLDMVESNSGRIIGYVYENINNIGNSTCTFNEENILYSKLRPYLNKVVIPSQKGYATSELVPLKPNKDKLNRYFLAYLLRSEQFVQYISEKVAGAKMPRVSMDMFRKFNLILPPIELQNKFAEFVKQIDKQKFEIQKSLNEMKELQESLMNKYFG